MGWKTFKPGRLVCSLCGYDGTTPPDTRQKDYDSPSFYWLENKTMVREVIAVTGKAAERGTIQVDDCYHLQDGGFKPRIQCGRCRGEFPIPEGAMSELIEKYEADWSEIPSEIQCPECGRIARTQSESPRRYKCGTCGHVEGGG